MDCNNLKEKQMESIQTAGFYKNDNGMLLFGANQVLSGSYNLFKEENYAYEYPVNGWYWFDSEENAREFFNLPKPPEQNILNGIT